MPTRSYAQTTSKPLVPISFNYVAERPEMIQSLTMPPRTITVSGAAFSTSAGAQECFDKGDKSLLPLSTSGDITEYQVTAVDENGVEFKHKLPFGERNEKLKLDNKSLLGRVEVLTRRVHDLEQTQQRQQDADRVIHQWQMASTAVEAYERLLLREPRAVSKASRTAMNNHSIRDVSELRYLSIQHRMDENERSNRTQAALTIYNSIPLHYRQILDRLVRAKTALSQDRTPLAHPAVKKSEIAGFLAPHFGHQTNPATELLRTVQDNIDIILDRFTTATVPSTGHNTFGVPRACRSVHIGVLARQFLHIYNISLRGHISLGKRLEASQ
ncbi:uncharacterized protein LACBIDRAFT_330740 [Laccaria bicolor S238N-H82]|uniref:Predicted protein n=1 Tax=Laccaria bicolor (strain S238N-H82 / ATCC MYA-4686) TaxID=486041 RepID=B0DMA6_LACBS|nr:uncharacterized protein LACBIDRAFT_330740 [Laccaria bicolor S238N-H82]EDR04247.1 predicted protein [Laccaria bicolor S238N-H82]|eukprot:XP_001885138.1 predicted protein [Laccaria bicolor S238N-H82]